MTNRNRPGSDGLGPAFLSLADLVYRDPSYEEVYRAICQAAVDLLPGCDHACITTMTAGGMLTTEGATDEVARTIDLFERKAGEGPCLDAILKQSFQMDSDITRDPTWPELSRLVIENTPVRGLIGYRILVGGRKAGALNVLSDTPGALNEETAHLGTAVAGFASVAVAAAHSHELAQNLRRGLESNREIGKAIGYFMATHQVRDDAAFEMLRETSNRLNVRLAELAQRIVVGHNGGVDAH